MGKEQSQSMDVLEKTQQEDLPQEVQERIKERRILIIVHQSRMGITNFDSCKSIQLNGRGIEAFYLDGTKKTIAFYEKDGRSEEVFEDLIYKALPQSVEVIKTDLSNLVCYLPEV